MNVSLSTQTPLVVLRLGVRELLLKGCKVGLIQLVGAFLVVDDLVNLLQEG